MLQTSYSSPRSGCRLQGRLDAKRAMVSRGASLRWRAARPHSPRKQTPLPTSCARPATGRTGRSPSTNTRAAACSCARTARSHSRCATASMQLRQPDGTIRRVASYSRTSRTLSFSARTCPTTAVTRLRLSGGDSGRWSWTRCFSRRANVLSYGSATSTSPQAGTTLDRTPVGSETRMARTRRIRTTAASPASRPTSRRASPVRSSALA